MKYGAFIERVGEAGVRVVGPYGRKKAYCPICDGYSGGTNSYPMARAETVEEMAPVILAHIDSRNHQESFDTWRLLEGLRL